MVPFDIRTYFAKRLIPLDMFTEVHTETHSSTTGNSHEGSGEEWLGIRETVNANF